jgi:hypothetical protein
MYWVFKIIPPGILFFFLENVGELHFIILRRLKHGVRAPLQHTHLGIKLHPHLLTNQHIDHTPHLASWEAGHQVGQPTHYSYHP